jgi:hypothetical protein
LNHQEGVMTTHKGGEPVTGGYYIDIRHWKLEAIEGAAGTLPGDATAQFRKVAPLAMLVLAPVLGLLFVIVLPFLGLAVVIEQGWRKSLAVVRERRTRVSARTSAVTDPRR